jgi:hypothetical protein
VSIKYIDPSYIIRSVPANHMTRPSVCVLRMALYTLQIEQRKSSEGFKPSLAFLTNWG